MGINWDLFLGKNNRRVLEAHNDDRNHNLVELAEKVNYLKNHSGRTCIDPFFFIKAFKGIELMLNENMLNIERWVNAIPFWLNCYKIYFLGELSKMNGADHN